MNTATCGRCGMEYEPVARAEHNGIHGSHPRMIDLGEGARPEDVEAFRRYWREITREGAPID